MTDELYKPGLEEMVPYPLHTAYLSRTRYLYLDRFEIRSKRFGRSIGEDAGYEFDFGSVPRLTEWFISRMEFGYSFAGHDMACDRLSWDDGTAMTQKDADDLFLEVALHVHKSRWMRFKARVAWGFIRAHSRTVKRWRSVRPLSGRTGSVKEEEVDDG